MQRRFVVGFVAAFLLFGMAGLSHAALTTIGTAQFGGTGEEYKLIWDDDNNGNSVVWLDYTKPQANRVAWLHNMRWAANLDGELTYNIDPAYTVDWGTNSWRLPTARIDVDGAVQGYEGDPDGDGFYNYNYGYNIAGSELGHLFYTELGNKGQLDINGNFIDSSNYGLKNTEDFNNLKEHTYWCSTEYGKYAWTSSLMIGGQMFSDKSDIQTMSIALRTGKVSAVPVPAAAWLLGSGLVGLVGARRKFNK